MQETYDRALQHILEAEGGYVNHPRDPGGCTNLGITIHTLRDWRGTQNVTCRDVQNLTQEEAAKIYKSRYWDRVRADELPPGLDLVVFDMAVNAGPTRAIKILQQTVGTDPDGILGPITMGAITKYQDVDALIRSYSENRRDFYRGLRTFNTFGRGWLRRVDRIESLALGILTEYGDTPPTAPPAPTPDLDNLHDRVVALEQAVFNSKG